jgi:hypothetical protein
MITGERTQELIKGLYDAVVNMDEDTLARELSQNALEAGIDASQAVIGRAGCRRGVKIPSFVLALPPRLRQVVTQLHGGRYWT